MAARPGSDCPATLRGPGVPDPRAPSHDLGQAARGVPLRGAVRGPLRERLQLGALLFGFLHLAFPHPEDLPAERTPDLVRWAVSLLVVRRPCSCTCPRRAPNRAVELERAGVESPQRLTYTTLFIASAVLLGDVAAVAYNLLERLRDGVVPAEGADRPHSPPDTPSIAAARPPSPRSDPPPALARGARPRILPRLSHPQGRRQERHKTQTPPITVQKVDAIPSRDILSLPYRI